MIAKDKQNARLQYKADRFIHTQFFSQNSNARCFCSLIVEASLGSWSSKSSSYNIYRAKGKSSMTINCLWGCKKRIIRKTARNHKPEFLNFRTALRDWLLVKNVLRLYCIRDTPNSCSCEISAIRTSMSLVMWNFWDKDF